MPRAGGALVLAAGLAALLGGCSSVPKALNPVEWWHGLQGGSIAADRPAPPGADDPYPNLGTVPERPPASDPKLRAQIADALIADRGNAQHEAVQLVDPSNPNAAPSLFGRGSAPPPAAPLPGAASARMPATGSDTPAPSGPPPMATERTSGVARAPVGAVQSTPLQQPDDASAEVRPALPTAPPPPANLPGAPASAPVPPDRQAAPEIPASTIAASPSSDAGAAPASATAAATPAAGPLAGIPGGSGKHAGGAPAASPAVGVPFATGSAAVPRPSVTALRQLAGRRGGASIAVTGYGEATGDDPAAQQAALSLALARAQAVAAALTTAGVPAGAIRVDAEAAGRGAAARLVE